MSGRIDTARGRGLYRTLARRAPRDAPRRPGRPRHGGFRSVESCPACGSGATFAFLRRPDVPTHQNLLLSSAAEARGLARGDLALRLCPDCGFGFNAAFRPELLRYGPDYDNTQTWSPAFARYTEALVRELVEVHRVRAGRVVEAGCGKGVFLRKLVEYAGA